MELCCSLPGRCKLHRIHWYHIRWMSLILPSWAMNTLFLINIDKRNPKFFAISQFSSYTTAASIIQYWQGNNSSWCYRDECVWRFTFYKNIISADTTGFNSCIVEFMWVTFSNENKQKMFIWKLITKVCTHHRALPCGIIWYHAWLPFLSEFFRKKKKYYCFRIWISLRRLSMSLDIGTTLIATIFPDFLW